MACFEGDNMIRGMACFEEDNLIRGMACFEEDNMIRGMACFEEDNLVIFSHFSASQIWPDKRVAYVFHFHFS
jgi:hypothetical protein